MERWFLAGAVVGLIILLFDKPLANEIAGEFIPGTIGHPDVQPAPPDKVLPSNPTGCTSCSQSQVNVAAPLSPPTQVQAPSTSTPARVYYESQVQGSPAPGPAQPSRFFQTQTSSFFN
jgi:hypothetical protein